MPTRKLGETVRALRENKGLTQGQLAERAQIALSYVTTIEGGQPGSPPRQILERLARALDVTTKKLLDPDG